MLFSWKHPTEADILNTGLNMSMSFGKFFLQPIQSRLLAKYNFLTIEKANIYNGICEEVRDSAQNFVYQTLENTCNANGTISEKEVKELLKSFIESSYPWVSRRNYRSLLSQACYFAWKDGLDRCLK